MNKKYITYLVLCAGFLCGVMFGMSMAVVPGFPETVKLGPAQVQTKDALGVLGGLNEALEEASQETRNYFERQFAALDHERKVLGNRKDSGKVGQLEYEQSCKALDARQARLEDEMRSARNNGQQISNGVQNLFMTGWQMVLDREREEDARKTKVAQAAVTQAVANEGALERFKFMLEKENLIKTGAFVSMTAAGVFGAYHGLNFLYKYLDARLGMPTLVRESSRAGVLSSWFGWLAPKKHVKQEEAFAAVVLAPELEKNILSLAKATAVTHEKGLQYRHMLLYGPPGTGKTLIARTLASASGMDYAIVSGADFSQFKPGLDVQKLHELFDWADQGKRGLILFIDEADALLRNRKELNEQGVNVVNAFLSRTNASSEKFMLILATNYPENLDAAVLSRVNKKIEVPLPGRDERLKLLTVYVNKYLKQVSQRGDVRSITIAPEVTDQYFNEVAISIDGFSGRSIDQLVAEVRIEALISEGEVVSKELFDRIVTNKIEQQKKESSWAK